MTSTFSSTIWAELSTMVVMEQLKRINYQYTVKIQNQGDLRPKSIVLFFNLGDLDTTVRGGIFSIVSYPSIIMLDALPQDKALS